MKKVTKTSKQAYKKSTKNRVSRCKSLMDYLSKGNTLVLTGSYAAKLLKLPRNEAAKRLSDLYAKGLIKKIGKTKNASTGCFETTYTRHNGK